MARKYYATFKDINNANWRVELWDDPSGSSSGGSEMRALKSGFMIEYQGDGDAIWENQIKKGKAVLTIAVDNSTDETFFQSLAVADEQKYAMVAYKGSDLIWIGRVIPDQISWSRSSLEAKKIYRITSIDGLSILKNFKVDPTWFSSATSRLNMLDLIRLCISKANLYQYWDYLGFGDNYINDCVQSYPGNLITRPVQFLKKWEVNLSSVIDDFNIYTEQTEPHDIADIYVNCYEAIENILQKYGAKILLYKGQYWITQPIGYGNGAYPVSFEYRVYSTAGVKTNSLNLSHRVLENTAVARSRFEAYPTITHQAAVRTFKTKYKRSGLLSSVRPFRNKSSALFSVDGFIAPQGNQISVKATLNFGVSFWAGATVPASSKVYIAFRIYAYQFGSVYVYDYNTNTWVNSGVVPNYETVECSILNVEQAGPTNAIITTDFFRNFSSDTGITGLKVDFQIVGRTNTAIGSGTLTNVSMWGDVNLFQIDKNSKVNAVGNANNASRVVEFTTKYYQSCQSLFDTGMIYDINTDTLPDSWRNLTGKIEPFVTASSSDFMALYARAVAVAQGNWVDAGNYNPVKSLIFDDGIWVFNGGKFDTMACQWDGEWLRMSNYPDDADITDDTEDRDYNEKSESSALVRILQQVTEQKVSTQNVFKAMPYRITQIAEVPVTTTPTIDTLYNVDLKFNQSEQLLYFNLEEKGKLTILTSGTYAASVLNPSILCNTTDGIITINLPAAATSKGVEFWFKKTATPHKVIVNGTIDGAGHVDINNLHGSLVIVSDGSVYWIKSNYP